MTRGWLALMLATGLGLVGCGDDSTGTTEDGGGVPGRDGASPGRDAAPLPDGRVPGEDAGPADSGVPGECDDGIDNDGDGLVDWQRDLGCWGPGDGSEAALDRDAENGFTTFDFADDSVVVYVSSSGGDDANDGSSPETAVQSLGRAEELVRDGEHDFMLLRRGDTWRGESFYRFKSGRDAEHPLVVASYGDSRERPRLEIEEYLINHDGRNRSFVALIGLHLVVYPMDPDDPGFADGEGHGGLRYVGGGSHLLLEDLHLEYGEIVVQSCCGEQYDNVEVRFSVVERSYHARTCSPGNPDGDPTFRPSGMYASHVDGLTLEGNLFDHNGWNPDAVDSACATIYNHNLYLNGNDVVIRDNLLTRASSIHIKFRSDTTGDMDGLLVENNYFVEGEIGISLGGNSSEPFRFRNSTIRRNVLSDLGRSRPTTRTLAWGIGLQDNDTTVVEDNLVLNHREDAVRNSWGLNVGGGTQRDVTVRNNLFFRVQNRALRVQPDSGHESVLVTDNRFIDPELDACLVAHEGGFSAYTYRDNGYYSSAAESDWFCGIGDLPAWTTASGETGAERLDPPSFPDPERDVESYAETLGLDATLEAFLAEARRQGRLEWRRAYTASALNDYIREGFGE